MIIELKEATFDYGTDKHGIYTFVVDMEIDADAGWTDEDGLYIEGFDILEMTMQTPLGMRSFPRKFVNKIEDYLQGDDEFINQILTHWREKTLTMAGLPV